MNRWAATSTTGVRFPLFGVSDDESLLVKLEEIGVRPHRDDINKARFGRLATAAG
jgi:hypothetical protein